jgi:hypothetical protein
MKCHENLSGREDGRDVLVIDELGGVDVWGVGVGHLLLDSGKVRIVTAEGLSGEAGRFVESLEATTDGADGTFEVYGYLGCALAFEVVEAENGERSWSGAGVEFGSDGKEHTSISFVGGLGGLRVKLGEEFAGDGAESEGAVGVEDGGGFEGEEGGAEVAHDFLGDAVEMAGGWGEDDERLVEAADELSDDAMEGVTVELNGEEYRDGVGRPGADLAGAVGVEVERAGFKVEDAGNDAGSVVKVEAEWDDLDMGERNIGAFGWVALAFGDERAVGQRVDAVGAEAVEGTGVELDSI